MRKFYLLLVVSLLTLGASAQVTTIPSIPTADQPCTIIFNAAEGDQGMKGYAGNDVYAYTGVLTNLSTGNTDWRYVVETSWTDNPDSCLMTKTGPNTYELTMKPSIRDFYGVPVTETIQQMAFVFRNSTASVSGRAAGGGNINVTVYPQGLNISFINPPTSFTLVNNNQAIPVKVSATFNDSIRLFLNHVKIASTIADSLLDTVYATNSIVDTLIATAYHTLNSVTDSVSDTISYLVTGNTQYKTLPKGVHDGINYIDDSTVTFVLFAPYKKTVYLIGDFNNWTPGNNYLMYEDTGTVLNPLKYDFVNDSAGVMFHAYKTMYKDSARFWITIHGLIPQKEYIFQYLIDGSIRIADPYVEKISDPDYDSQIPSYIYPNLIAYPSNKTTGIAGVIQTDQTPYQWQVTNFVKPNQNNLVIYELLIRDFSALQDIQTVMDSLPYLKRLGVNAIELMPFSQFDGNDSWGYNPSFYFAPAKAYGTREAYKQFIDACHLDSIAVIQDMVLDFSTNNSPLTQMYFANGNPTAQNPWYDVTSPNTSYVYGNVFNHDSPYTKALCDSITSFWMTNYKIDGFRFDFVKGWTNTFGEGTPYDSARISNVEQIASHMWKVDPNAYVILELFTAANEETLLANYGTMIWNDMNGNYESASISKNNLGSGWNIVGTSYQSLGYSKPNAISYMESHDQERIMVFNLELGASAGLYHIRDTTTALKRMELDNAFFLTVPGPKMIWQFGELGYDTSINYNSRVGYKPVLWQYYKLPNRKHLYDVVSALNKLKATYPVFSTTNFTMNVSDALKNIELVGNDTTIEVVGNFDVESGQISVQFPSDGIWHDYFTGDTINVPNSLTYLFTLNPGEYRMYSNYSLIGQGNLATAVQQVTMENQVQVYPNPFGSALYVESTGSVVKDISIYNIQGEEVIHYSGGNTVNSIYTIDTSALQPGMYFVNISLNNGTPVIKKIIKN